MVPSRGHHPSLRHGDTLADAVSNGWFPARTATVALTNATMDYALRIANKGYKQALADDANLRNGLNVYFGKITNAPVANDLGYEYHPPEEIFGVVGSC